MRGEGEVSFFVPSPMSRVHTHPMLSCCSRARTPRIVGVVRHRRGLPWGFYGMGRWMITYVSLFLLLVDSFHVLTGEVGRKEVMCAVPS